MNTIYVYYHVAQMGNWEEVMADQTAKLRESGLYDETSRIYVGVVGTQGPIVNLPEKFEILFHDPHLGHGENPTLEALHQHALKEDFMVLYMHTKGVSYQKRNYNKENMTAWRNYLEHFCIKRWRECAARLDRHDAVGCEYKEHGRFFRGNFWWSKSSYLKKLPRVADTSMHHRDQRRKAEFWLRDGPNFKPFSLFDLKGECSKRGYLYKHAIDPKLYIGKSPQ